MHRRGYHPNSRKPGNNAIRCYSAVPRGHDVLRDVDIKVPVGETLAVVGRVGSGKATLARLVPRLIESGAGQMFIDGVPIEDIPLRKLRTAIGYVPQDTFLFSDTIRENVALGTAGGQKQRTALARAVARDPSILILDDALASVDTRTEEAILKKLRQVMKERTTILIAHRISTVKEADQILVLDGGGVAERGTHCELVASNGIYADMFRRQHMAEEWGEL